MIQQAERLAALAAGLQTAIDRKRAPREENTYRKARMAASAREDAVELELVQTGLRALSSAWSQGIVPDILKGLNNKAAVEELLLFFYGERNPRYQKHVEQHYGNNAHYLNRFLGDPDRLIKAGISDIRAAYDALYTLIDTLDAAPKHDPQAAALEAAIREVRFLKIEGYFPTPKAVVARMLEHANVLPGQRVLEPSAGSGNIADALRALGAQVDVVEIAPRLIRILELKGYTLAGNDFMTYAPSVRYDCIVMNPPFENGQDMLHVQRAYDLLKPGGRVVAITSPGPFFRSDKRSEAFRKWLDSVPHTVEALPEGAFKESGTGVATRLLVIDHE